MSLKYISTLICVLLFCFSCKKTGWTPELKNQFTNRCKLLVSQDTELDMQNEDEVNEFCECMLEITIHEFSPTEVAKQSDDDIKERFPNCERSFY